MTIRYDPTLNSKMRNIVTNFNRKVNRMEKAGYRNIPFKTTVSELKGRYTSRRDLTRELSRLQKFTRHDLVKDVETSGGVKAIRWEMDYLKGNKKEALAYFKSEYERVSKRVGKFPGERQYLDNIQAKIDLLNSDINYLNQSQFRSFKTVINEFAFYPTQRKYEYRGFLSEVDWVMEKLGYDEATREKLFNKFSKLTPSQFLYAYDNNNIIAKIYSLYHKDYGDEEARLTDEPDKAKGLIDDFIKQVDVIVNDAKTNMD